MIITRRVYEFVFSALAVSFFLVSDGRGIASAAEMVGEAHRIVNSVTGVGAAGNRRLSAADPVYRDEDVSALVDSRGELTLMDGSRLVVGENSTITLDDFVIAGDSFSQGTISVAKGAFRFISGNSGQAIEIHTPLAKIGIRGTIADVYVREGGVTDAVVLQGQLIVCTLTGICTLTQRTCDIVRVSSPTDIQAQPFLFSNRRSAADQAAQYPLAQDQLRYSANWQAFLGGCSQRAAQESTRGIDYGNSPDSAPDTSPPAPSPPSDNDNNDGGID